MESMEITTAQIAVITVLITMAGTIFGAFKWINATVEAAKKEALLTIDRSAEAEGKLRHSLANTMQTIVTELRRDLEMVKREGVRREEMTAMEARLVARSDKIEVKLDHVSERLAEIASLSSIVRANAERLERFLSRHASNNGS